MASFKLTLYFFVLFSVCFGYILRPCNGNGFLINGECECAESFSGLNCENFVAFACVNGHCEEPGTYCSFGNVDCSVDLQFCKERTGWCLPMIN